MKILTLHLLNVNSLKGEHRIDFDQPPLSETGLFAIVGPTGAGKSSLLDAITLALFNQVPRLGESSRSITKSNLELWGGIMTRGTRECFAEVSYRVGGKAYRSKWSIRMAKTGNMQDYHMELADLDQNRILDLKKSEVPAENERIIGLSFSQFVKSMMLSQGEFAKFLRADAKDRSELLERITGTEIYRLIGAAAYDRAKLESLKLNRLEERLKDIRLMTEEERTAKRAELEQHQAEALRLQAESARLADQRQARREEQKLHDELHQAGRASERLRAEALDFAPRRQRLLLHESLQPYLPDLRELRNLLREAEDKQAKLQQTALRARQSQELSLDLRRQLAENQEAERLEREQWELEKPKVEQGRRLEEELRACQKSLAQAQARAHELAQKQQQASQLAQKLEAERLRLAEQVAQVEARVAASAPLDALAPDVGLLRQQVLELDRARQELKGRFPEAGRLAPEQMLDTIGREMADKTRLLRELEPDPAKPLDPVETQARIDLLREKLLDLKFLSEKDESLSKALAQARDEQEQQAQKLAAHLKGKEFIENKQAEKAWLEARAVELRATIERQKLEAKYEQARHDLRPGQACPLCGSEHHPYAQHGPDKPSGGAQAELSGREEQLKAMHETLTKAEKRLSELEVQAQNHAQQAQNLLELAEKEGKAIEALVQKHGWDEASTLPENREALRAKLVEQGKAERERLVRHQQAQTLKNELRQAEALALVAHKALEITQSIREKLAPHPRLLEPAGGELARSLRLLDDQLRALAADRQRLDQVRSQGLTLQEQERQARLNGQALDQETQAERLKAEAVAQDAEHRAAELHALLGGRAAERIADDWSGRLTRRAQRLAQLQAELARGEATAHELAKAAAELEAETAQAGAKAQALQGELLPKLQALGLDELEAAARAVLPQAEALALKTQSERMEKERHSLDQTLERLTEAHLLAQELNRELPALAELEKLLAENQEKLAQRQHQAGALDNQLREDQRRLAETQALLSERAAQRSENQKWEVLARQIGDSNGNKFSKFAQEMTLRQLVGLANRHLGRFNPRYRLEAQEQGLDDLFVADTFQGLTRRSVKTLSGGESFLVSLALALSLADLASRNSPIESLFIDEGFGTLDQQSLDLALDALERLQSETNRTIGLISHVPLIKERLTTQVEVVKSSTGHSSISLRS